MTGIDSALSRLVLLGLEKASLGVLEEMLRALAKDCGGFGATLWQLREVNGSPPAELKLDRIQADPSRGQLYVLAHGFDVDSYRCAYHDLPLTKATGQAVLFGEFEVEDAALHPLVDHDSNFAKQVNTGSMYAVRVSFPDHSIGAVTLYRREKGSFDQRTREDFSFLASHVPALYASVRDRVAYRLVDGVSVVLAEAESFGAPESQMSVGLNEEDAGLREVCSLISKSLGCLETTIFLADRQGREDSFGLAATSCAPLLGTAKFSKHDPGITPYIVRTGKPLNVLDMMSMPAKLRMDTGWISSPKFVEKVCKLIGLQEGDTPQPFAFAGVPMLSDGRVIGVLRCSICGEAPYFLAQREIELLEILASRIAGYWRRKLRFRGIHDAERSWAKFVNGLSELTQQTQTLTEKSKSMRSGEALRKEIFGQALAVLQRSIPGADTLEVALVDSHRKTIGPTAHLGQDWELYLRVERGKEPSITGFPLDPPSNNSWAYVCDQKRLEFIRDTAKPEIPYAGLLPRTRQALFAPVLVDDECVGVLGIRSHSAIREPEKAKSMATLAALVVALYYQLTKILSQQLQVYQDLEHQLRSPIFQAYKRIKLVVQEEARNPTGQLEDRLYDLNAINGLLSKAKRVLGNVRLYEQLAMEQQIAPNRVGTPISEIIKLMKEAAADNRLLWTHKRIGFRVAGGSFERLKIQEIPLDVALFEQVMNNLLDNAAKYGEPGSLIQIEGSQDEEKRMEITVRSKGLTLFQDELPSLGVRGFRSESAKLQSAEGMGSGLYLVCNIMRAHNGLFIPHATDAQGSTSMTVVFPTTK